jgi:hypothetical protein
MSIYIPSKRVLTSQPQGFVELDNSNQLAKSISYCLPLNGLNRELVTLSSIVLPSGYSCFAPNQHGLVYSQSTSNNGASCVLDLSTFDTFTISMWIRDRSVSNANNVLFGNDLATSGFLINNWGPGNSGDNTATQVFIRDIGGSNSSIIYTRPTIGTPYHLAVTVRVKNGNAQSVLGVYINGQAISFTGGGGSGGPGNFNLTSNVTDTDFNIGWFTTAEPFRADSELWNLVIRGNYLLSAEEVKAEYDNPWQIYKDNSNRLFYFPSVSGHNLTANNCNQDSSSASGAVSQSHTLAGSSVVQANTSTSGSITQQQLLTGANLSQAASSSIGTIQQTCVLTAASCGQACASTSGAITQTHLLSGSSTAQAATSSIGSIALTHALSGAGAVQSATSSSGAITTDNSVSLTGSAAVQDAYSTSGYVTQTHNLTGSNSSQSAASTSGSVSRLPYIASTILPGVSEQTPRVVDSLTDTHYAPVVLQLQSESGNRYFDPLLEISVEQSSLEVAVSITTAQPTLLAEIAQELWVSASLVAANPTVALQASGAADASVLITTAQPTVATQTSGAASASVSLLTTNPMVLASVLQENPAYETSVALTTHPPTISIFAAGDAIAYGTLVSPKPDVSLVVASGDASAIQLTTDNPTISVVVAEMQQVSIFLATTQPVVSASIDNSSLTSVSVTTLKPTAQLAMSGAANASATLMTMSPDVQCFMYSEFTVSDYEPHVVVKAVVDSTATLKCVI